MLKLSSNARTSLMRFAKEKAKEQKERFDKHMKEQIQAEMDKAEETWKSLSIEGWKIGSMQSFS